MSATLAATSATSETVKAFRQVDDVWFTLNHCPGHDPATLRAFLAHLDTVKRALINPAGAEARELLRAIATWEAINAAIPDPERDK